MNGIREMLEDASTQARYYDVSQQVLRNTRRWRRRRQRAAIGAGASLATASVLIGLTVSPREQQATQGVLTASASPTPRVISCVISELPRPSGYPRKSFVTGGDATGRYLLGRGYSGRGNSVLLWDHGRVSVVPMPGEDSTLNDINSKGTAVGTSFLGENVASWVYRDGKVTRLAGGKAAATAINENDQIVGELDGFPAIWRTPTSQPERLPLPEGKWMMGTASDITDDATIIGGVAPVGGDAAGPGKSLMWKPDGTVRELTVPIDVKPAVILPRSIKGDWILGSTRVQDGVFRYARWNQRTGVAEMLPQRAGWDEINARGDVVSGRRPALLVDGRQLVELPTTLEGYTGEKDPTGTAHPAADIRVISDDGRMIGGTMQQDHEPYGIAVKWTCQ